MKDVQRQMIEIALVEIRKPLENDCKVRRRCTGFVTIKRMDCGLISSPLHCVFAVVANEIAYRVPTGQRGGQTSVGECDEIEGSSLVCL